MNVREIIERPPDLKAVGGSSDAQTFTEPRPLAPARFSWQEVRKVLLVRLRSIGDTVLATPALHALRRFLPEAEIDILLEDWVAPVLEGFPDVSRVITVERGSVAARARVAKELRGARYDVAFNLHGGTTATLLTRASGARHRVGYGSYRYSRLYNHAAPPANELWGKAATHSVEQQLALLGWTGVPVSDRPRTHLAVTDKARESIRERLRAAGIEEHERLALFHPAAAFETKQWRPENFARVAEALNARSFHVVAVAAPGEAATIEALTRLAAARIRAFTDLALPEVTALAARSALFVGNDSGIAHMASAVSTPSVVIFGSSNIEHWRPWANPLSEAVREELPCQPCPGYSCAEFEQPECIRRVSVERVLQAIERVIEKDRTQNSGLRSQNKDAFILTPES
ncbi:MAG TPA: glycosyltransferase family 9 protein [Pyrinomonadaceae bacterium]|nr:glycosyltransferase family 9 protein [Pyrinomonadaceae bacterium]